MENGVAITGFLFDISLFGVTGTNADPNFFFKLLEKDWNRLGKLFYNVRYFHLTDRLGGKEACVQPKFIN